MLRTQRRDRRLTATHHLVALVVVSLVAAACGGDADDETAEPGDGETAATTPDDAETPDDGETAADGEMPSVTFLAASSIPVNVAIDQGFYEAEGLDLEFQEVGEEQEGSLFIGGDAELGAGSPWDVARLVSEGEAIRSLSTAGATNFVNGVLVQAEDADQYQEITDLEGQTLGIPGFGSGTWQAFAVMVDLLYDLDAREDFENRTASPGALLGLLGTGEIEAALLFSGQTVVGVASDEFERIFSFTEAWQERTGESMVIDMYMAKAEWAEQNPDQVEAFIRGTDQAAQWMQDNPDAFRPDGQYAELARGEGWLDSPEATDVILQMLGDGELILTSEEYDEAWIEAMYGFIEESQGVLIEDEVPPVEEIFYPAEACC